MIAGSRARQASPGARRARVLTAASVPLLALALAGCSEVQQAVDTANQAIDGAQSLLDAPARIGAACESALAALATGEPPDQARAAMDTALADLDQALGEAGALPGISQLRDAFVAAAESLAGDAAGAAAARSTVETACAPFTS